MVVPPAYIIQSDFSCNALQKLLCSMTNCLCSRTVKFGHPCCKTQCQKLARLEVE